MYPEIRLAVTDVLLDRQSVLGRGHFGVVYQGSLVAPARHPAWEMLRALGHANAKPPFPVALKMVQQGDERHLSEMLLEARLHAHLDHPHLVKLLGVQEQREPVFLALELCTQGSLLHWLRGSSQAGGSGSGREQAPSSPPSLGCKVQMALQIGSALGYLHSKLCLHRDIAARNVLVFRQGNAQTGEGLCLKLSDLGLSRALPTEAAYYTVRGKGRRACRTLCQRGGLMHRRWM